MLGCLRTRYEEQNRSHFIQLYVLFVLPNAMNAADITDKLGLHSLRQRNWYIQATCATSGEGLYEGLDWLSGQLPKLLTKAEDMHQALLHVICPNKIRCKIMPLATGNL